MTQDALQASALLCFDLALAWCWLGVCFKSRLSGPDFSTSEHPSLLLTLIAKDAGTDSDPVCFECP